MSRPGVVFAGSERAAEPRLHTIHLEELGRRLRRDQPLGLADAGEVGVPVLADGERVEDLHALADIAVGGHGKPGFEAVEVGVVVIERDQTIGLVVRQRPQQHAVDDREDRRVRADAQRERHHDDQREPRVVKESTDAHI